MVTESGASVQLGPSWLRWGFGEQRTTREPEDSDSRPGFPKGEYRTMATMFRIDGMSLIFRWMREEVSAA